jgi:hypothetical protein
MRNNIKIWFPSLEDEFEPDDLNDAFDICIYELKKVFCTSIALKELFDAKLNHFQKIVNAYNSLASTSIFFDLENITQQLTENFTGNILETFDQYSKKRNEICLKITATSIKDLNKFPILANKLCLLEKGYSSLWQSSFENNKIDVAMSKIPDPMEIRKALKNMQTLGIFTFNELSNEKTIQDVVIKTELNRRILISNYGK